MSYKIVNRLNYKSSVYRFIITSLPMIYFWKYKGIGLCSLVSKDSDICLQHSIYFRNGQDVTSIHTVDNKSESQKTKRDIHIL